MMMIVVVVGCFGEQVGVKKLEQRDVVIAVVAGMLLIVVVKCQYR